MTLQLLLCICITVMDIVIRHRYLLLDLQASMLSGLRFHNRVSSGLPIFITFPPLAFRSSPILLFFGLGQHKKIITVRLYQKKYCCMICFWLPRYDTCSNKCKSLFFFWQTVEIFKSCPVAESGRKSLHYIEQDTVISVPFK